MSHLAPHPSDERFAALLRGLSHAVVTQGLIGRIANLIAALLVDRFRTAIQRFAGLADKIRAGAYRPRRVTRRKSSAVPRPPQKFPLPQKRGWLADLLPDAAPYRGQLLQLLQQPETLALIEAAPAPMARLLRPLCWALRFKPPQNLPSTRRPAGSPAPPAPPPYRPPPPRPPAAPEAAPANMLGLHLIQLGPPTPAKPA